MTNFIRNRNHVEINTGAMADIAFLLLVFFLVATTVNQDQGLTLRLLPMPEGREIATIKDRNLFKVAINSHDQILVQGKVWETPSGLRTEVRQFIMNYGRDQGLSEEPRKAVISLKTNARYQSGYIHCRAGRAKSCILRNLRRKSGNTCRSISSTQHRGP